VGGKILQPTLLSIAAFLFKGRQKEVCKNDGEEDDSAKLGDASQVVMGVGKGMMQQGKRNGVPMQLLQWRK
jgi:hypothetical protein